MGFDPRQWSSSSSARDDRDRTQHGERVTSNVEALLRENDALRREVRRLHQELDRLHRQRVRHEEEISPVVDVVVERLFIPICVTTQSI